MSIKAPSRHLDEEVGETMAAQLAMAPKQLEAQRTLGPGFADVGVQNFLRTLQGPNGNDGLLDAYSNVIAPRMAAADAAAATGARGADVADLERYGPRAVSAIQAADPRQQALMGELNRQAMEGLTLGSKLDPGLRREVAQSVRAGQAARGFGRGTNDLAEEAMFTGLRANQLRQQRQQFAQGVGQQNAAQAVDPFLAIIGRPSQANPQLLNAGVGSAMGGTPSFDPFNQYGQDYHDTRYNARAAAKIATGNANAALWGSAIEAAGSLAGAAAAGCWVARAVYGETNPKWKLFRQWLTTFAPDWFFKLYVAHGPAVADWLKDKPRVKAVIRWWMDARIRGMVDDKILAVFEKGDKYAI